MYLSPRSSAVNLLAPSSLHGHPMPNSRSSVPDQDSRYLYSADLTIAMCNRRFIVVPSAFNLLCQMLQSQHRSILNNYGARYSTPNCQTVSSQIRVCVSQNIGETQITSYPADHSTCHKAGMESSRNSTATTDLDKRRTGDPPRLGLVLYFAIN